MGETQMIRTTVVAAAVVLLLGGHPAPAGARPTAAQKCAAGKMRCVAKEFASALTCHAKAALSGSAVDAGCLAAAEAKQASCWRKADSKGGCLATFPADHLHDDVADWTADVASD